MKLTPAEYDRYYESHGIKASDLLSLQNISLDELPADMGLSDDEQRSHGGLVREWNQADARQKIDMAQAMERAALKARRSVRDAQVDASLAYLMFARVRGSEERRETMRRIATGELTPPLPKTQKRSRRPAKAPSFREQVDARLRAKGLEVVIEKAQETTEDGDTVTIHNIRTRPISSTGAPHR